MTQRWNASIALFVLLCLLASAGGLVHHVHLRQCEGCAVAAGHEHHGADQPADSGKPGHNPKECQICQNLLLGKALAVEFDDLEFLAPVELGPAAVPESFDVSRDITLSLFARPPPVA